MEIVNIISIIPAYNYYDNDKIVQIYNILIELFRYLIKARAAVIYNIFSIIECIIFMYKVN